MQPEALAQRERHGRMRVVERSRGRVVLTQEADRLDQLVVAVGDRRHLLASTVAVLHDDRAPPMDLDVLHVRQVQQRLQAAIAEDGVLDRLHVRELALGGPQVRALTVQSPYVITDDPSDDRAAQQDPVLLGQRSSRTTCLRVRLVRDRFRRPTSQTDDLLPLIRSSDS